MENKELMNQQNGDLVAYDNNYAYGFEDSKSEDLIIPRIKVIQATSAERADGTASEGELINSLTGENVQDKRFIPIKQYYSNIEWNPERRSEPRILCRSLDGKTGSSEEYGMRICAQCRRNQWNNNLTGKEAQPKCTTYLNFLGFFEDNPMPVVLSFAKTNYNEGKKMLSIAKSMRAAIWNYAYTLSSKRIAKDGNTWYIMQSQIAGATTPEERQLAFELYRAYEKAMLKADYEDVQYEEQKNAEPDAAVADEI